MNIKRIEKIIDLEYVFFNSFFQQSVRYKCNT